MLTLDEVLSRLQGVKKSGDQWVARCPAHDDNAQSLSVGPGQNGNVVLKCFCGCEFADIIGALKNGNGMEPKKQSKKPNPPEKKEIIAVEDYCDGDGSLLYQTVRYRYENGSKTFRQRVKTPAGDYVWSIKASNQQF